MKKQSGLTNAGFVLLLITFIVQTIVVVGSSAISYSQLKGASFSGFFQMAGQLYSKGGFSSVLITIALFAPLLWAIAFKSEGRGRFAGRIVCGILLTVLSAFVYIRLAGWMESSIAKIGSGFGTAVTMLRVMLYGAIAVTALMLISIFFSVRATGIISAVGVAAFIGLLIYVMIRVLGSSNELGRIIAQEVGYYTDLGVFLRNGNFTTVVILLSIHCFMILLGKFFCCLSAGRKH